MFVFLRVHPRQAPRQSGTMGMLRLPLDVCVGGCKSGVFPEDSFVISRKQKAPTGIAAVLYRFPRSRIQSVEPLGFLKFPYRRSPLEAMARFRREKNALAIRTQGLGLQGSGWVPICPYIPYISAYNPHTTTILHNPTRWEDSASRLAWLLLNC